MKFNAKCPHCDRNIKLNLNIDKASPSKRRGPPRKDIDPEVVKFIVTAIEEYRSSFRVVGKILEERRVLTPAGSKIWHSATVKIQYDRAVAKRIS